MLVLVSPGPAFAIVVKNSLMDGRTSGLYISAGIACSDLCHVAVNLLGIGIIIAKSVVVFTVMKILGASYLIYLGYKGLQAKRVLSKENNHAEVGVASALLPGKNKGFYSGFFTGLLNPKAYLFFLSFFSVILSPATKILTQVFYGLWLCTLALLWFTLVALFFTNPVIGRKIETFKHWLERFTGGVLMLLGLKLLSSKMLD